MDTKEKDDSLLVFSLLKKNYNYLSYDALRRQVMLGTNLTFGKIISALNTLIDHKTLQHNDSIPFYYRTNPHQEKKSLRDLYDPLILKDPDISNALKRIYGIRGLLLALKYRDKQPNFLYPVNNEHYSKIVDEYLDLSDYLLNILESNYKNEKSSSSYYDKMKKMLALFQSTLTKRVKLVLKN